MDLQVGVKVLLKNQEGKYLLMRRSPYEKRGVGKWDLAGGRVEIGFSLMDNLAREVKEETGLRMMSAPKLLAAQDIVWPDRHVVRITYTADTDGEPTLGPEHSEYKWFSIDEMRSLDQMDDYFAKLLADGLVL
jgi:ADP-ribose pyrophosphatase YjhB (NUDIX family)